MTQALDAAEDAAHATMNTGDVGGCLGGVVCPTRPCACAEDIARAALRAALPAEPTPEMREVLIGALYGWQDRDMLGDAERAYRALRAHLLGEDA